jgi:branched-subunit amino acid transport protein
MEPAIHDWLLVAAMALVTFVIRYALLALGGRVRLSPDLMRALAYVPPVVLTAIVVQ